jgi:tRNA nucleotidyltransferase (CCA-adding enzyme)
MLRHIPEEIRKIIKKFSEKGYELYLVGGSVRNILLEKSVKDWDFTTNATPEQIQELFPNSFYDNKFGTVGIPAKNIDNSEHNHVVEVTTFRTERGYTDKRHPEIVEWGKTIDEDLARRDFTMNAIALKINHSKQPSPLEGEGKGEGDYEIVDSYGGRKDIEQKVIRAVGDPEKRFKEDALRLMRAIRFSTQLGFSIEPRTLAAISEDAPLLAHISQERIRDELIKILASDYPYEGIMLLKNTGLLDHILPELSEGIGVSQERPGRHHKDDVFTHNLLSLKHTPSTDPIVRFAALIHDVAKPRVAANDPEGYVIFHNHEIEGAKMAYEISVRLRLSKKDRQKVVTLVRWHMFTVDEHTTDASVRRFIRRIGVDNIRDMIDLRIGDRLGSGTATAESWRLKLFKKRIEEQLAPAPFSINDLAIDGNDIMKELDIKPSRKVGEILQKIFEEVDEDLSKNNKEFLLTRVKELA